MKTLREVCIEDCENEGFGDLSEALLYETFEECLSTGIVQNECEYESRWYDRQRVVHSVKIDGVERYFSTFDYHITGDNCASDMDLPMPTLKDVREVFPEVVQTTIYK